MPGEAKSKVRERSGLARRAHVVSDCGQYEWTYTRRWADGPSLTFVGLNPSFITIDPEVDADGPTIRRMQSFASREGYGALRTLNLYAFRSTNPAALWATLEHVGPENDGYLSLYLEEAATLGHPVVACWGAYTRGPRSSEVLELVAGVDWRCLGRTSSGHPRHPLYVRSDAPLTSLPH